MRVLVVDDDIGMRTLLTFMLKRGGHDSLGAGDGAEALNILQQQSVDLVITDLMMPVMDGSELITTLRQRYEPSELPIIAISAVSSELQYAAELGADITLSKPIMTDALTGAIERLFAENPL